MRKCVGRSFFPGAVAFSYFLVNVAFGHSAETNFWRQRQRELSRWPASSLALAPLRPPLPLQAKSPSFLQSIPDNHIVLGDSWAPKEKVSVILLQDLHGQPEAQENISGFIAQMGQTHPDLTVGAEGAAGLIDFGPYRRYPDKQATRQIARAYFKKGWIGGVELSGITSNVETRYVGVEDAALYAANIHAYETAHAQKQLLLSWVNAFAARLRQEKSSVFTSSQIMLDQQTAAFGGENSDPRIYSQNLVGAAGLSESELSQRFPSVAAFQEALSREKSLDLKAAEIERENLIRALAASLGSNEVRLLLPAANKEDALGKLIKHAGLSWSDYPRFQEYLRYTQVVETIDRARFFDELIRLEEHAWQRTQPTPRQDTLRRWAKMEESLRALAGQDLTDKDWALYQTRRAWLPEIQGHTPQPLPDLTPFEDFYVVAQRRNNALVDNLLKAKQGPLALLVVGGFHTAGISQELKKRGVGFVVVSPKITHIDKSIDSLAALVQGKTPLDKVLLGEKLFLANPVLPGANPSTLSALQRSLQTARFCVLWVALLAGIGAASQPTKAYVGEGHFAPVSHVSTQEAGDSVHALVQWNDQGAARSADLIVRRGAAEPNNGAIGEIFSLEDETVVVEAAAPKRRWSWWPWGRRSADPALTASQFPTIPGLRTQDPYQLEQPRLRLNIVQLAQRLQTDPGLVPREIRNQVIVELSRLNTSVIEFTDDTKTILSIPSLDGPVRVSRYALPFMTDVQLQAHLLRVFVERSAPYASRLAAQRSLTARLSQERARYGGVEWLFDPRFPNQALVKSHLAASQRAIVEGVNLEFALSDIFLGYIVRGLGSENFSLFRNNLVRNAFGTPFDMIGFMRYAEAVGLSGDYKEYLLFDRNSPLYTSENEMIANELAWGAGQRTPQQRKDYWLPKFRSSPGIRMAWVRQAAPILSVLIVGVVAVLLWNAHFLAAAAGASGLVTAGLGATMIGIPVRATTPPLNPKVRTLLDRLKDGNAHQRRAFCRVATPWAREPLMGQTIAAMIMDPDDSVRVAAIEALGHRLEEDAGLLDRVAGRLEDRSHFVRRAAVEALAPFVKRKTAVKENIQRLLGDPHPEVRLEAFSAAAVLLSDPEEEVLRERSLALLQDDDVIVRRDVVQALAPLLVSNEDVRDTVFRLLEGPRSEKRQSLVEDLSLLAVHDPALRRLLSERLGFVVRRPAAPKVQQHVFHSPVESLDPAETRELRRLALNPASALEAKEVFSLAPIDGGDEELIQALIGRLEASTTVDVRVALVAVLGPLAGVRSDVRTSLVRRIAASEFIPVRVAALEIVAPLAGRFDDVFDALANSLEGSSFDEEKMASFALRRAGFGPAIGADGAWAASVGWASTAETFHDWLTNLYKTSRKSFDNWAGLADRSPLIGFAPPHTSAPVPMTGEVPPLAGGHWTGRTWVVPAGQGPAAVCLKVLRPDESSEFLRQEAALMNQVDSHAKARVTRVTLPIEAGRVDGAGFARVANAEVEALVYNVADAEAHFGYPSTWNVPNFQTLSEWLGTAADGLAVVARQGWGYTGLLSFYHDVASQTRHNLDVFPVGCLENVPLALRYANIRAGGLLVDLNPEHMIAFDRHGPTPATLARVLRAQTFQLALLAGLTAHDRGWLRPDGAGLAGVLEELGDNMARAYGAPGAAWQKQLPVDLATVAREFTFALNHRQGANQDVLGHPNGPFSAPALVAFAEAVGRAVASDPRLAEAPYAMSNEARRRLDSMGFASPARFIDRDPRYAYLARLVEPGAPGDLSPAERWENQGAPLPHKIVNDIIPHMPVILAYARYLLEAPDFQGKKLVCIGRGSDLIYDVLEALVHLDPAYAHRRQDLFLVDWNVDQFAEWPGEEQAQYVAQKSGLSRGNTAGVVFIDEIFGGMDPERHYPAALKRLTLEHLPEEQRPRKEDVETSLLFEYRLVDKAPDRRVFSDVNKQFPREKIMKAAQWLAGDGDGYNSRRTIHRVRSHEGSLRVEYNHEPGYAPFRLACKVFAATSVDNDLKMAQIKNQSQPLVSGAAKFMVGGFTLLASGVLAAEGATPSTNASLMALVVVLVLGFGLTWLARNVGRSGRAQWLNLSRLNSHAILAVWLAAPTMIVSFVSFIIQPGVYLFVLAVAPLTVGVFLFAMWADRAVQIGMKPDGWFGFRRQPPILNHPKTPTANPPSVTRPNSQAPPRPATRPAANPRFKTEYAKGLENRQGILEHANTRLGFIRAQFHQAYPSENLAQGWQWEREEPAAALRALADFVLSLEEPNDVDQANERLRFINSLFSTVNREVVSVLRKEYVPEFVLYPRAEDWLVAPYLDAKTVEDRFLLARALARWSPRASALALAFTGRRLRESPPSPEDRADRGTVAILLAGVVGYLGDLMDDVERRKKEGTDLPPELTQEAQDLTGLLFNGLLVPAADGGKAYHNQFMSWMAQVGRQGVSKPVQTLRRARDMFPGLLPRKHIPFYLQYSPDCPQGVTPREYAEAILVKSYGDRGPTMRLSIWQMMSGHQSLEIIDQSKRGRSNKQHYMERAKEVDEVYSYLMDLKFPPIAMAPAAPAQTGTPPSKSSGEVRQILAHAARASVLLLGVATGLFAWDGAAADSGPTYWTLALIVAAIGAATYAWRRTDREVISPLALWRLVQSKWGMPRLMVALAMTITYLGVAWFLVYITNDSLIALVSRLSYSQLFATALILVLFVGVSCLAINQMRENARPEMGVVEMRRRYATSLASGVKSGVRGVSPSMYAIIEALKREYPKNPILERLSEDTHVPADQSLLVVAEVLLSTPPTDPTRDLARSIFDGLDASGLLSTRARKGGGRAPLYPRAEDWLAAAVANGPTSPQAEAMARYSPRASALALGLMALRLRSGELDAVDSRVASRAAPLLAVVLRHLDELLNAGDKVSLDEARDYTAILINFMSFPTQWPASYSAVVAKMLSETQKHDCPRATRIFERARLRFHEALLPNDRPAYLDLAGNLKGLEGKNPSGLSAWDIVAGRSNVGHRVNGLSDGSRLTADRRRSLEANYYALLRGDDLDSPGSRSDGVLSPAEVESLKAVQPLNALSGQSDEFPKPKENVQHQPSAAYYERVARTALARTMGNTLSGEVQLCIRRLLNVNPMGMDRNWAQRIVPAPLGYQDEKGRPMIHRQNIRDLAFLIWAGWSGRHYSFHSRDHDIAKIMARIEKDTILHEHAEWSLEFMTAALSFDVADSSEDFSMPEKVRQVLMDDISPQETDIAAALRYRYHQLAQRMDDRGEENAYDGLLRDLDADDRAHADLLFKRLPAFHPLKRLDSRNLGDNRDEQIRLFESWRRKHDTSFEGALEWEVRRELIDLAPGRRWVLPDPLAAQVLAGNGAELLHVAEIHGVYLIDPIRCVLEKESLEGVRPRPVRRVPDWVRSAATQGFIVVLMVLLVAGPVLALEIGDRAFGGTSSLVRWAQIATLILVGAATWTKASRARRAEFFARKLKFARERYRRIQAQVRNRASTMALTRAGNVLGYVENDGPVTQSAKEIKQLLENWIPWLGTETLVDRLRPWRATAEEMRARPSFATAHERAAAVARYARRVPSVVVDWDKNFVPPGMEGGAAPVYSLHLRNHDEQLAVNFLAARLRDLDPQGTPPLVVLVYEGKSPDIAGNMDRLLRLRLPGLPKVQWLVAGRGECHAFESEDGRYSPLLLHEWVQEQAEKRLERTLEDEYDMVIFTCWEQSWLKVRSQFLKLLQCYLPGIAILMTPDIETFIHAERVRQSAA